MNFPVSQICQDLVKHKTLNLVIISGAVNGSLLLILSLCFLNNNQTYRVSNCMEYEQNNCLYIPSAETIMLNQLEYNEPNAPSKNCFIHYLASIHDLHQGILQQIILSTMLQIQ